MANDIPKFEDTEEILEGAPVSFEETEEISETSIPEAAGLGAVEAIPFGKDVLAAGETLVDTGLKDFGEEFSKNKREWQESINKAKEDQPLTFNVADIATGTLVIPGGAVKTLGRAAMFGAASALSRSEERTPVDALVGAAGGALGAKVAEKVQGLGKLIVDFGKKGVPRSIGATNAGSIKKVNEHIIKNYNPAAAKKHSEAVIDFADDILKEKVNGVPLLSATDSMDDLLQKALQKRDVYGDEIGKVLKKTDSLLGKDAVNTEKVYKNLKDELVDPLLESSSSELRELGNKFLKKLNSDFINETSQIVPQQLKQGNSEIIQNVAQTQLSFKKFSLSDLHRYFLDSKKLAKNAINKSTPSNPTQEMFANRARLLNKHIDDIVDSADIEDGVKGLYKTANKNFGNMSLIADLAGNNIKARTNDPVEKALELTRARGLFTGMVFAKDATQSTAAGIAIAANEILTNPNTPTYLAKGASKLAALAKDVPDHKLIKRLGVAATLSSDAFREALGNVIGEMNLIENAVARNSDDVLSKSDDILQVLTYHDKNAADQLRSALQNNDMESVGQIMDSISKLPAAKDIIEPGIGWDGKVYSAQDRALLEKQVSEADISLHQKLQHKKALRENGTIPQLQPELKPILDFIARDKKNPKF